MSNIKYSDDFKYGPTRKGKMNMSNFAKYLIGTLFVAGGLAWAANKLGASLIWTSIGVIVIIGIGIMAAVSKTQKNEKTAADK
jgi:hypothetical protein